MATHGSVGEFNPDREDWISYTERLTQYFVANGISEEGDKRKAILLSSLWGSYVSVDQKLGGS